jgi:uncharacterized membrane protein
MSEKANGRLGLCSSAGVGLCTFLFAVFIVTAAPMPAYFALDILGYAFLGLSTLFLAFALFFPICLLLARRFFRELKAK